MWRYTFLSGFDIEKIYYITSLVQQILPVGCLVLPLYRVVLGFLVKVSKILIFKLDYYPKKCYEIQASNTKPVWEMSERTLGG